MDKGLDPPLWGQEINELLSAAKQLQGEYWQVYSQVARKVMSDDCLSVDGRLPEPLATSFECLLATVEKIQTQSSLIAERYLDPVHRALRNWHLTEEQYRVVRAADIEFVGLLEIPSTIEGFEHYRTVDLFYFKCDKWFGYINVNKRPGESRFGAPPELCSRRFLRAEQHEFFRTTLPEVYGRFTD